jgi:hypothetical protein
MLYLYILYYHHSVPKNLIKIYRLTYILSIISYLTNFLIIYKYFENIHLLNDF